MERGSHCPGHWKSDPAIGSLAAEFFYSEIGDRVWRDSQTVLKDCHAIRFDRRPPAARAPTSIATTATPVSRRLTPRHLDDDDGDASARYVGPLSPTVGIPLYRSSLLCLSHRTLSYPLGFPRDIILPLGIASIVRYIFLSFLRPDSNKKFQRSPI